MRIWKAANALSPDEPQESRALRSRLEEEFREELRYRALAGLGAEPGALRVDAHFAAPDEAELARFRSPRYEACFGAEPRAEASGSAAAAGGVFRGYGTTVPDRELSLAILVVLNTDTRPVHVAVLSVSEDRQRNAIWPQEGERDRVLEPGASVRVPVNVVSNPRWAADRPMRDRYLVLTTLEPADFTPLTRETLTRGEAPPVRMPGILALAMERPATRGLPRASTDRSAYGLRVVDLYVEPRERR